MPTVYQDESRNAEPVATHVGAISVNKLALRHVRVRIDHTGGSAEQDTKFDFKPGDIIEEVFVNVVRAETAGTAKTLNVGLLSSETGGDTDGFIQGISVATTGVKQPSLLAGSETRGALLKEDADATVSTVHVPKRHVISTAVSLVYQLGSADFADLIADIHVLFWRLETDQREG